MAPESLWAKSARGDHPQVTLVGHTQDVLEAARGLFGTADCPCDFAWSWLRFFKLQPADLAMFIRCLRIAAALHDLGKASADFQEQLLNPKSTQLYRHEHLSGLMMVTEPLSSWLQQDKETDWDIVLSAVVCHHLKAAQGNDSKHELAVHQVERSLLKIHTQHPDFAELLGLVAEAGGLPPVPGTVPPMWSREPQPTAGAEPIREARRRLMGLLEQFQRKARRDEHRQRLLHAVRSALMVADAVGSGIVREGMNITQWLDEMRQLTPVLSFEDVEREIIQKRIDQLHQAGVRFQRSDFQQQAETYADRALLLAPCGSGKTLAAWWWIASRMKKRPARHCLFLYPTRATTTEGFRDYVAWAPEQSAALLHGTAGYGLEGLFQNPDDQRFGLEFQTDPRLFALGFWGKQFFSATVDQFFSFLQYRYAAMCLLPVLADAVVVVDEVHSFDRSMFSAVQDFLNEFDVPVLCMTATLPRDRQERLEKCGLQICDAYQDENLKTISEKPRYLVRESSVEEAEQQVRAALGEQKKVLWVVNTVHQAQEITRRFARSIHDARLETMDGVPVYCYHSRYRLCDRQARHAEIVAAFQSGHDGAVLGITTQVCEMGLDLNADLLVSEAAPVTSLIQRMGRCNRSRVPKALSESGQIIIYPTTPDRPYSQEDLLGLETFLQSLGHMSEVTQATLEAALREVERLTELKKGCPFLRSGPFAASGGEEFREIEEFNLTAVLDSDAATVVERKRGKSTIDGFLLPVPKKFRNAAPENPPGLPAFLFVAPSRHYLPLLGFFNEPIALGDTPSCPLPQNKLMP